MRISLTILLLAGCITAQAQPRTVAGRLLEADSKRPVAEATIRLRNGATAVSDESGAFRLQGAAATDTLYISAIGYAPQAVPAVGGSILLQRSAVELAAVTIASAPGDQLRPISQLDIKLRGINNAQEVLRMVPGLFIGQHAGGGKAEQIFLRGFDLDHGTDINISVDGMPVNMVSHAHGQGYADLHFLIPELIENVTFKKGTYYPEKGNFTTTGFVDFRTVNFLPSSSVKVEGGMYGTARTVGLFDLLGSKGKARAQSAYIGGEYLYSDGYFEHPQNFRRYNLTGKYYGQLAPRHTLQFSASTFSSDWDASGQIPDRAVAAGLIGYYGAIDPNEGGKTGRSNINAQLTSSLSDGSYFKNQLYYSHYRFELYSNFTFYKEDPVNGDQIRQRERRDLYGYNGSYHRTNYIGKTRVNSELGAQVRLDRTQNSELSRTRNRSELTAPLRLGNISESNLAAYLGESFTFSPKFSMNAGLRFDHFEDRYHDKLDPAATARASASTWSPKLSFYYQASEQAQIYLSNGKGFHSNDTRAVVTQKGLQVLPAAYGTDLGVVLKPAMNLLVNAAIWYLWLDQEFVYVGDEGVVEPSGKSRRYGADLSVRYQPWSWLYADVDLNYSNPRAVGEPKDASYLPLAPHFTSIGGLTAKLKSGWSFSLRYRQMSDRPANENNTVVAKGYFITDAFASYARKKYEVGLSVQNLFNTKWKETQFDTESRLMNEAAPVSEIHFTPGTPLMAKLSLQVNF